jgi:DNA topoisomerase IA
MESLGNNIGEGESPSYKAIKKTYHDIIKKIKEASPTDRLETYITIQKLGEQITATMNSFNVILTDYATMKAISQEQLDEIMNDYKAATISLLEGALKTLDIPEIVKTFKTIERQAMMRQRGPPVPEMGRRVI